MTRDILAYARNPKRFQASDFIHEHIENFSRIHGDRLEGDDAGVICGLGRMCQRTVAVIAQNPGHSILERMQTGSGMTRPMGYRMMQRMLRLGEKFHLPLLALIDTPGADASIEASKRNQSAAIADNMRILSSYPHPSISIILNQGMSGGAMALAMTDRIWMLEHALFSVISPEGCASILWRDNTKAALAAHLLHITAPELLKQGLIDAVIAENNNKLAEDITLTFEALLKENAHNRLHKRYTRFDRL